MEDPPPALQEGRFTGLDCSCEKGLPCHAVQETADGDTRFEPTFGTRARYCATVMILGVDVRSLAIILAGLLLLIIPIPFLSEGTYAAFTGGVQAFVVIVALVVAVRTLLSDSKDRRVDRVLALHEELTSGPTGAARTRLAHFLKQMGSGDVCLQVSREQLQSRDKTDVSAYLDPGDQDSGNPERDLTLILRLFDRVRIAQAGGTVDDLMLVGLVGRHAGWWDMAIAREDDTARIPLEKFATWCDAYVAGHRDEVILQGWGEKRRRNFPNGAIPASALAPRPTPAGPATP